MIVEATFSSKKIMPDHVLGSLLYFFPLLLSTALELLPVKTLEIGLEKPTDYSHYREIDDVALVSKGLDCTR